LIQNFGPDLWKNTLRIDMFNGFGDFLDMVDRNMAQWEAEQEKIREAFAEGVTVEFDDGEVREYGPFDKPSP
jgi:hypothetical protein